MSPYFSIIMPSYNRADKIGKAIQSVLSQIFQDWELVIIDDGSTDDTKNVIDTFRDQRIQYYYQENSGRSAARNKGLRLSQGAYINFLDDDDELKSHHLQLFYDQITSSNQAYSIYRTGFEEHVGEQLILSSYYDVSKHRSPIEFVLKHMAGIGSQVYNRSVVDKVRFKENYFLWEDTFFLGSVLRDHDWYQIQDRTYIYHNDTTKVVDFTEAYVTKNNIAPILAFFEMHQELPKSLRDFLIAQKYMQYSIKAKHLENKTLASNLFSKSKEQGVYRKLWRFYFSYLLKSK